MSDYTGQWNAAGVPDGLHTVTFTVIDTAGVVTTVTEQVSVSSAGVITPPPGPGPGPTGVVLVTPPPSTTTIIGTNTGAGTSILSLQGTATGVASVAFVIDRDTGSPLSIPVDVGVYPSPTLFPGTSVFPSGSGSTGSSSFFATYDTALLPNGTHTVHFRAFDSKGVVTDSATLATISVDNVHTVTDTTPPTNAQMISPPASPILTAGTNVGKPTLFLDGTAQDPESGIAGGFFTIDGSINVPGTRSTGGTATDVSATYDVNLFAQGVTNHTVTFTATNGATPPLNSAPSPSVTFTVNNVVVVPPPSGSYVTTHGIPLDDYLNLKVRTLRHTVEFELLDVNGTSLGALHPRYDQIGTVRWDGSADIQRQLSGLEFFPDDTAHINVWRDRVQVWWKYETGDRVPVGRFVFADNPQRINSTGQFATPQLSDFGQALKQLTWRTISYGVNQSCAGALRDIFDELQLGPARIDDAGALLSAPLAWPAGSTTWLDIIKQLVKLMGTYPLYFDALGVPIIKAIPELADASPDFRYTPGRNCRILNTTDIQQRDDLTSAPNTWIAVDTAGNASPIYGKYELPPTAPQSYANRGYRVVKKIDGKGFADNDAAINAARAAASNEQVSRTITFDAVPDPHHDCFNTVQLFDGVVYTEQSWSLPLHHDGYHQHTVRRVVNPGLAGTGILALSGGTGSTPPGPPPGPTGTFVLIDPAHNVLEPPPGSDTLG